MTKSCKERLAYTNSEVIDHYEESQQEIGVDHVSQPTQKQRGLR